MIRRILSRRSRSRRLYFLDDLSSYYLGFRYDFWPPPSFAWGSRICGLFVSHLLRKVHVSKHPVRDVPQFCTSCISVCDVWWSPVSSPCSYYRSVRRMLASSRNHIYQIVYAQIKICAWESRISGWCVFCFPDVYHSFWPFWPLNDPPVRSILRFRS